MEICIAACSQGTKYLKYCPIFSARGTLTNNIFPRRYGIPLGSIPSPAPNFITYKTLKA